MINAFTADICLPIWLACLCKMTTLISNLEEYGFEQKKTKRKCVECLSLSAEPPATAQNKSGTHKKIKDFNKQKTSEKSEVIINEGIEAGKSLVSFRTST